MQITEKEIASIEEAGMLDGRPVKLIRTKGGFWIACGKPKGKIREEALAAGSHPAVVRYNLEKQYPTFQPAMMKSEVFSENVIVEKHSHFLSNELRKSGHDIYSIQDGSNVRFDITKHNLKIASAEGTMDKEFLVITNLNIPKEFSKGIAGATVEKSVECKVGLRLNK